MTPDPQALGAYLRAQRIARDPIAAGVQPGNRRRTPGLRREEVATLAGVSIQYLIRLERGAHRTPSAEVLNALARVLGLDEDARAHLLALAGRPSDRTQRPDLTEVPPAVLRLVERCIPDVALVLNRRRDVLAHNAAFTRMFPILEGQAEAPNLLRLVFGEPAARGLWAERWPGVAADAVAHLRERHPGAADDPLIAELLDSSPDFAALWPRHDVRCTCGPGLIIDHPVVGPIALDVSTLEFENGDLQLVVWTPARLQDQERWSTHVAGASRGPLRIVETG